MNSFCITVSSFEQLAERVLDLLDLSVEVRCIHLNDGSTLAGESLVRLEPSGRFRRISSAIAARDADRLIVEHVGLIKEKLKIVPLASKRAPA